MVTSEYDSVTQLEVMILEQRNISIMHQPTMSLGTYLNQPLRN